MAWQKYGNKKVTVGGITFDSKKEANRWQELKMLKRAGQISGLQRQVKVELIPAQYEETPLKNGKVRRACVERECSYVADFVYRENGKWVYEDTKGFKTPEYIIKRKLMLYIHGIKIKEI